MGRQRLGLWLSPAGAGPRRAGLCVVALWWQEVRGREGEARRASWAHPYGSAGRGRIPRVTGRELTRATVGTRAGWGGTGGRALQGHQARPPAGPATVAPVVRSQRRQDRNTDRGDMARGARSAAGAEGRVAGALRAAHPRAGVLAARVGWEPALRRQQRGRWRTEAPPGAAGSLGPTGWCSVACTPVGPWLDPLWEQGLESLEASGGGHRARLGGRGEPPALHRR